MTPVLVLYVVQAVLAMDILKNFVMWVWAFLFIFLFGGGGWSPKKRGGSDEETGGDGRRGQSLGSRKRKGVTDWRGRGG